MNDLFISAVISRLGKEKEEQKGQVSSSFMFC